MAVRHTVAHQFYTNNGVVVFTQQQANKNPEPVLYSVITGYEYQPWPKKCMKTEKDWAYLISQLSC